MDILKLGGQVVITFNLLTLLIFLLLFAVAFFALGWMVENRHWINVIHGKEVRVNKREAMMPLGKRIPNSMPPRQGPGGKDAN